MSLITQDISTTDGLKSPNPCGKSTNSGVPPRSCVPFGSKRPSTPPPTSTTNTEGVSPVGSHKPNTAVPQAFYNKEAGTKALTTETGAGPVGVRPGDGV